MGGWLICTRVNLEIFLIYVNCFHPALNFTLEISESCVSFRDISVSINGASCKFTTSVSYTDGTVIFCFRPPTLTTQNDLSVTPTDFGNENLFFDRGYPSHQLDSAIQKAFSISRPNNLKQPLKKISYDKIPLVLTFHPSNCKVMEIISRNF